MFFIIRCNWASPTTMKHTWSKMTPQQTGRWGNIEITDDPDKADYIVIINSDPSTPLEQYRGRTDVFYFSMEPRPLCDDTVFLNNYGHHKTHNLVEWHLGYSYDDLSAYHSLDKLDRISVVQSAKNFDVGHKKRIKFVELLNRRCELLDCFGTLNHPSLKHYKGSLPWGYKEKGLIPYKYHFACENNAIDNYFTEKIVDGILSECVVFYWGCPNVEEYIPAEAFIRLELEPDTMEQNLQTVLEAIRTDEWSRRIDVIRQAKHHILNNLQVFPHLEQIFARSNK